MTIKPLLKINSEAGNSGEVPVLQEVDLKASGHLDRGVASAFLAMSMQTAARTAVHPIGEKVLMAICELAPFSLRSMR
jgi:hypothetical protein